MCRPWGGGGPGLEPAEDGVLARTQTGAARSSRPTPAVLRPPALPSDVSANLSVVPPCPPPPGYPGGRHNSEGIFQTQGLR